MNDYGLNDEQLSAINSPSPCYITAAAGSGKTRCLVSKMRQIIDLGNSSESILAITFTNKAASEMKERLKKYTNVSKMQISTMHSMAVRIIKAFIHLTYLKIPFTIYDDSDQLSIIKTIVKSRELPGDPYEYLSIIGRNKSNGTLPEDEFSLEIFNQYHEILKQNNACDFDDLLIFSRNCLKNDACRDYFSNKWKHILVDEAQDTSKIQYEIITLLYTPKTLTMFIIGDVNQSIYGWRGAYPQNIKDFIKTYNASTKHLTYNYRSCSDVISIANGFQQFGSPMIAKSPTAGKVSVTEFENQQQEAERVAQAILKMGNFNETAIIYRMNGRSLLFEQTLARFRIPYKVVNELPFFQRRVTKDLLAALKASNNPLDRESLCRVINNPKRGFGDAKKEQLLVQGLDYVKTVAPDMPLIQDFLNLLDDIKGYPPAAALEEYLNRSGYRNTIEKDSDHNMVASLQDAVVNYETVEELILASTFLERDSGEGVNLLTAHGSKGLEFDRVFVVGVEDGVWPHKNSVDIEEEHRLFYVAVTRARKWLNLSYSKSKMYRGNIIPTFPSQLFTKSFEHLNSSKSL